jgi:hypothetical protein
MNLDLNNGGYSSLFDVQDTNESTLPFDTNRIFCKPIRVERLADLVLCVHVRERNYRNESLAIPSALDQHPDGSFPPLEDDSPENSDTDGESSDASVGGGGMCAHEGTKSEGQKVCSSPAWSRELSVRSFPQVSIVPRSSDEHPHALLIAIFTKIDGQLTFPAHRM